MSKLISTVNYPVTIKYGNDKIVVSPNETIKNVDKNKVGNLPNGIVLIKD